MSAPPVVAVPVVDDNNPWPGLLAFNEHFRRFFYGRSSELDELFRRVRQETLTVLYAQSGLGKTSLLQAGLFHRLREEGFLPVPIRIDYGGTTEQSQSGAESPQRQILAALAGAISGGGAGEASDPRAALGVWEYLHDVDLVLNDRTGSPLTPVLIFDQFEELFTLGAGRRDDGRFADQVVQLLGDLVENRPPRALERALAQDPDLVDRYSFTRGDYRVLLSLREDYLPHLHGLRRVIPSIILNNQRLTRFNRQQALEVVERPAAASGLVSHQVAEAIVRTVAGLDTAEAGAAGATRTGVRLGDADSKERLGERVEVDPALLCLFCRELNRLRQERGERSISLELVAGSKETVLHDFYVGCFAGLSPPPEPGVKAFVEDYLLTSKGYRDRLTVERATEILVADYHGRPEELTVLVDRRLLQIEERGKTPQIELTHDVLAPIALAERVERTRNQALLEDEQRRQEELRRAAQEEREAKEREAAAAAALATARRRQRQTLALLGVVAVAAGAAVIFALVAYDKAKQARIARDAERNARTAAVNAESTAVKERNIQAGLARQLAESTKVAQRQRDLARGLVLTTQLAQSATARTLRQVSEERATADSLVSDLCDFSMDLLKTMGDSTEANTAYARFFNIVIDKTDYMVDKVIRRREVPCTRQLSLRTSTAGLRNRRLLGASTDTIRALVFRALAATRTLAADTSSRRVAAQSYYDLVYEFHQLSSASPALQDTVIRVAAEGLRIAAAINPARDSGALNRIGRINHYAAIALTRRARVDSARLAVSAGLDAVARGQGRRDQDQDDLLLTESQLRMRQGEADSAQNRPDQSLAEFAAAVTIARTRLQRFAFTANRRWLAVAHSAHADMAVFFNRAAEAFTSYDSSAANYRLFATRQLDADVHDTTAAVAAFRSLSTARVNQARAALRLGRPLASLSPVREAVDARVRNLELRSTSQNQRELTQTYSQVFELIEGSLARPSADSLYDAWFRQDSARTAAALTRDTVRTPANTRTLVRTVDQFIGLIARRLGTDTVGQSDSVRARMRLAYGVATLRYRIPRVWLHREIARRDATPESRSNLGSALGDLSWSYLLAGRPGEAATAADEGLRISPGDTFIIPNWVNGVLLGGEDIKAEGLFRRFAGQQVEIPPIRFECAVQRDLIVLWRAGVASDRHLATFQRFLGDLVLPCLRPNPSSTQ